MALAEWIKDGILRRAGSRSRCLSCCPNRRQGPTRAIQMQSSCAALKEALDEGDGKNWKERLTEKQKTFAVLVVIQSGSTLTIGSGTPLTQMKVYKTSSVASSSVPGQRCVDVKATVPGLPLHFCNPSASPVGILGRYIFIPRGALRRLSAGSI
jgi:hypothetical protein